MKPIDILIACGLGAVIVFNVILLGGCCTTSESQKQSFWLKQITACEMRQAEALERIADRVAPRHIEMVVEQ